MLLVCVCGRESAWAGLHFIGVEVRGWGKGSHQIPWRLGGLQAKVQSSQDGCSCLKPFLGFLEGGERGEYLYPMHLCLGQEVLAESSPLVAWGLSNLSTFLSSHTEF